jgi:hypothetical protein
MGQNGKWKENSCWKETVSNLESIFSNRLSKSCPPQQDPIWPTQICLFVKVIFPDYALLIHMNGWGGTIKIPPSLCYDSLVWEHRQALWRIQAVWSQSKRKSLLGSLSPRVVILKRSFLCLKICCWFPYNFLVGKNYRNN